jgi:hypothetical protein
MGYHPVAVITLHVFPNTSEVSNYNGSFSHVSVIHFIKLKLLCP